MGISCYNIEPEQEEKNDRSKKGKKRDEAIYNNIERHLENRVISAYENYNNQINVYFLQHNNTNLSNNQNNKEILENNNQNYIEQSFILVEPVVEEPDSLIEEHSNSRVEYIFKEIKSEKSYIVSN